MFTRILSESLALAAVGDVSTSRWWAIVLGCLFAIVALSLLIASWTRWGQTKSLTKCIALAFLAHIWLLMYAYGTRFTSPGAGGGYGGGPKAPGSVTVSMQSSEASPLPPPSPLDATSSTDDSPTETSEEGESSDSLEDSLKEWERPVPNDAPSSPEIAMAEPPLAIAPSEQPDAPEPLVQPMTAPLPEMLPDMAALQDFLKAPAPETSSAHSLATSTSVQGGLDENSHVMPPRNLTHLVGASPIGVSVPSVSSHVPRSPSSSPAASNHSTYQNRFATNRMDIVRAGGGDENTEAAVEMALEWLARAQGLDGGWHASDHGGGQTSMIRKPGPDGEYRENAGVHANTAMTGLALLSFLGAGHHHLDGKYSATVQGGLRYLISQQLPSGDMSGRDQIGRESSVRFARMYSHGMASLAVAEAYAITRDPQLLPTIQLACQYSLRAMNARSGGWRYEYPTDDPGDTSQFGWQAMLLHSASHAQASSLTNEQRNKLLRFLDSVAAGRDGGLATYRPRLGNYAQTELATPSMTSEALASRLLLGFPVAPSAAVEAQRMIMTQLPGREQDNFYYWYYATLALYQLRAAHAQSTEGQFHETGWKTWNDALKMRLCATQIPDGPNRGAWNPTCVWGAYGGRVYTTALGCMCLEVYYRYLPVYQTQIATTPWADADPSRR